MQLLYYSLALYLSLTSPVSGASSDTKKADKPCTITSPNTGSFFDLSPLEIPDPSLSTKKKPRDYSYNATGYGLGYNFTANICGPVVEKKEEFVGVDKDLWKNVSAYYVQNGKKYALGLNNSEFVLRGKKLVLNYTGGSPCEPISARSAHAVEDLWSREIVDGPDKKKGSSSDKSSNSTRRKSMIISMLCDRDPLAPTLGLSFIASPDECSYFFEARTSAACAIANTSKGGTSLNPGSVFGVIILIAVAVYFVGGCVYNRTVLQQRGWQQVPNYQLWSSIWGFFRDLFIIATSSCARFLPSRRGYSRVNGGVGNFGSRRGRSDSDAENRLIDELNEEWED